MLHSFSPFITHSTQWIFPLSCQFYSLYNLSLMLVLMQQISLLHFAPTISKIGLYLFLQAFHERTTHTFSFRAILFLNSFWLFFLKSSFSIRFSVLTIPTFFTPLRSISFDPRTYQPKSFSSNLAQISMLNLLHVFVSNIVDQCHSLDEALHTLSKSFSSFCHFFQLIYLPINNSSSIS